MTRAFVTIEEHAIDPASVQAVMSLSRAPHASEAPIARILLTATSIDLYYTPVAEVCERLGIDTYDAVNDPGAPCACYRCQQAALCKCIHARSVHASNGKGRCETSSCGCTGFRALEEPRENNR